MRVCVVQDECTTEIGVSDASIIYAEYDGSSVKEKIYLNLFSLPFIREKNKFKYIFTPVYWGEKID